MYKWRSAEKIVPGPESVTNYLNISSPTFTLNLCCFLQHRAMQGKKCELHNLLLNRITKGMSTLHAKGAIPIFRRHTCISSGLH